MVLVFRYSNRNADRNRKSVGKLEILRLLGEQSPLRLNEGHGNSEKAPSSRERENVLIRLIRPESRDKEEGRGKICLVLGPYLGSVC